MASTTDASCSWLGAVLIGLGALGCLLMACQGSQRADVSLAADGGANAPPPEDVQSVADAGDASRPDAPTCTHPLVVPDCAAGWCRIPAGCFVMGSPPDEPGRGANSETQVQVTLTHAILVQQHEMTQDQWIALGLVNFSGAISDIADCMQNDCPVGNMNWFEALAAANAHTSHHAPGAKPCYDLSDCSKDQNGRLTCGKIGTNAPTVYDCAGFRLPTDAEWEYVARAGTSTAYYSGPVEQDLSPLDCAIDSNLDPIAWYCRNAASPTPTITRPVGKKKPNAWGLHDMLGNAFEWTNDRYRGLGYGTVPLVDPYGFPAGLDAVALRGGSVMTTPPRTRCAVRSQSSPGGTFPGFGLRLVRTIQS